MTSFPLQNFYKHTNFVLCKHILWKEYRVPTESLGKYFKWHDRIYLPGMNFKQVIRLFLFRWIDLRYWYILYVHNSYTDCISLPSSLCSHNWYLIFCIFRSIYLLKSITFHLNEEGGATMIMTSHQLGLRLVGLNVIDACHVVLWIKHVYPK